MEREKKRGGGREGVNKESGEEGRWREVGGWWMERE